MIEEAKKMESEENKEEIKAEIEEINDLVRSGLSLTFEKSISIESPFAVIPSREGADSVHPCFLGQNQESLVPSGGFNFYFTNVSTSKSKLIVE
jgi:hypothetical protein